MSRKDTITFQVEHAHESILNNRETAILIWVVIGITFLIFKKSVREPIIGLIKTAFARKLVTIYALALLYTSLGVIILFKIKLWTPPQLKETLLWLITVASVTSFNINKIKENKKYFSDALKDNLKLTVLLEFVTGLYPFNLAVELLIVPISLFLGLMLAFSQHKLIQSLFTVLASIMGFLIIGHSIYQAVSHIHGVITIDKLREFIVSPFLSIWFLPFLYVLARYMSLEVNFIAIGNAVKSDKLSRFAKKQAIIHFYFDDDGLERWKMSLFRDEPKTKPDIVSSIKKIRQLQKIEKSPPLVDLKLGWSPYEAKDFLVKCGIKTSCYTNLFVDEWAALSNYVPLDESFMANNISFHVIGNEFIAKRLELYLSVQLSFETQKSAEAFLLHAKALHNAALKKPLPRQIENAITKVKNEKVIETNITVSIHKEEWADKNKGYTLTFSIHHTN